MSWLVGGGKRGSIIKEEEQYTLPIHGHNPAYAAEDKILMGSWK